MSIDIDKLEALARAATDGPWSLSEDGSPVVNAGGRAAHLVGPPGSDEEAAANTQFIVAADPTTILALIGRLREAEAREQALAAREVELSAALHRLSTYPGDCDQEDYQHAHGLLAEGLHGGASLARRDAEQQKIGAASFRHEVMESVKAPFRPHIQGVFEVWLRRQAKQADTAGESNHDA